jgi:hypothetical protein
VSKGAGHWLSARRCQHTQRVHILYGDVSRYLDEMPQRTEGLTVQTCHAGGMKGAPETRQQVLSLYRNILRAGRTWQGSAEVSTPARSFRSPLALSDPCLARHFGTSS